MWHHYRQQQRPRKCFYSVYIYIRQKVNIFTIALFRHCVLIRGSQKDNNIYVICASGHNSVSKSNGLSIWHSDIYISLLHINAYHFVLKRFIAITSNIKNTIGTYCIAIPCMCKCIVWADVLIWAFSFWVYNYNRQTRLT